MRKGFGTFETKFRQVRNGLDPRNLTPIAIPPRGAPIFRCGNLFKEDIICGVINIKFNGVSGMCDVVVSETQTGRTFIQSMVLDQSISW